MSKRIIGNIVATLFAIGGGLGGVWASEKIRYPDDALSWIVVGLSGLTVGMLVFFITWGHFQSAPVPPKASAE